MENIEIVLTQDEVKKMLLGGTFICNNATVPILKSIKCTIVNNRMTVESTNIRNDIKISFDLTNKSQDVEFCVEYNEIKNTLNAINDETISLCTQENMPSMLIIKHSHGKMKIPMSNISLFPKNEQDEIISSFDISTSSIVPILYDAVGFVCNDELRAQMCGVNLRTEYDTEKDETILQVNSTDAQKLYQNSIYIDNIPDINIIINTDAINTLNQFIDVSDTLEIQISNKKINFIIGNDIQISSLLIEGKFPNVDAAIPKENNIIAKVNVKELKNSLSRIRNSSNKDTYTVKATFENDSLKLETNDIEYSKKAIDTIHCNCNENLEIGFSLKYIYPMLNVVSYNEEIELHMSTPRKAIIIKDNSDVIHDSKLILLLMPMLLSE